MGDRRVTRIFFYLLIVAIFGFVLLAAFAAPDKISGIDLGYWFAGLFVSVNLVLCFWVLVLWIRRIRN